jgi:putative tryptophan/tyrosine transport system substrate-binding protein
MRRREFIALVGSVTAAWPLAALAQQLTGIRRLGVLLNLSENDAEAQRLLKAFREGLAQLGWTDGRNLRIDYRWAGGDVGRIRTFAKELVELSPDIMVGYATPRWRHCNRRPAPSPSCSYRSPTRLAKALSRAWHIRAAI